MMKRTPRLQFRLKQTQTQQQKSSDQAGSTTLSPETVAALRKDIFRSLNVALPGSIVSYDSTARTASIRPLRAGMPLLTDVPVFTPASSGSSSSSTISEGDYCLVIFADHDIDAWFASENPNSPPGNSPTGNSPPGTISPFSSRMHSLSDGFAFVGFKRPSS